MKPVNFVLSVFSGTDMVADIRGNDRPHGLTVRTFQHIRPEKGINFTRMERPQIFAVRKDIIKNMVKTTQNAMLWRNCKIMRQRVELYMLI